MNQLEQSIGSRDPHHLRLLGVDGRLADKLVAQWFLPLPEANPMLLGVYAHRETDAPRALLPWSGEYAGKYLTAAAEIWAVTGSDDLHAHLERFVARLASLQAKNGYLGPWDADRELTGLGRNAVLNWPESSFESEARTWDAWGHYHLIVGTITWYELTGDETARSIALRIVNLFCDRFLGTGRRLVEMGNEEMNMAVVHGVALAYRHSGDPRHLQLAEQLLEELPRGNAGNYVEGARLRHEFFELPGPRWESLHILQGIAELARHTGKTAYLETFDHFWWSIAKTDIHNTGGFSSGEGAVGNPYDPGAIETCCTVAWMALSVDQLMLSGRSLVADELELSYYNGGRGALSPSGRWSTYNTPMDGARLSSQRDIMFQSRPGSPELNCCSVNAQRLVGIVSRWGIMRDPNGAIVVNYYGPSRATGLDVDGSTVTILIDSDYPAKGDVRLTVTPSAPRDFEIKLRIPFWSRSTRVEVVDEVQPQPTAGTYLSINRTWHPGDTVALRLDLRPYYWAGERECAGRSSVYRGPVLLCLDTDYSNSADPDPELVVATARELGVQPSDPDHPARVLVNHPATDGSSVTLCDFASGGHQGNWYRSWLKVRGTERVEFSKSNPLHAWWPMGEE